MKGLYTILLSLTLLASPVLGQGVPQDFDLPFEHPKNNMAKETRIPPPPEDPVIVEDPPSFYGEPIPSSNMTICYVVDISCSMGINAGSYVDVNGNRLVGNRLDKAKAELTRSIVSLPRSFKFNIIGYSCTMVPWRIDNSLVEATAENKAAAISWMNTTLQVTGGTGTGFAVAWALQNKQLMSVVLLTDGAPGCYAGGSMQMHRNMILHANTQNAVVDVFGISATGLYRQFCQDVATDNSGSYIGVN